jgi:fido (protein-threonine AMPylation protein)
MMNDFEEYIRQGEPNQREKGYAWQTAIGLQKVDGLQPSAYLIETAKQNIEGDISLDEVKHRIDTYYQTISSGELPDKDRTEEADKVSIHIAEILSEKTFSFSPAEYISIHKRLFEGIYPFAGKIREYNITKSEWVLNGETVYYASFETLKATLEYDFEQEKTFNYKMLSKVQIVEHITRFVANLWQIHMFGEGNTRTTAVFIIKYLQTLGFDVTNDLFANNAWYFRNALVRANYNNFQKNIHATNTYLELFFRNLLLGENNVLKNRYLHIDSDMQSEKEAVDNVPKSKNCTLNCTLEEKAVLHFIKNNPKATQKEIAKHIGKSERTVKTLTSTLQQKQLLERLNGKRNGYWMVK